MGQKVNPIGFRLGVNRDWTARWYSGTRNYAEHLISDLRLREFIKEKLKSAAVSLIVIERPAQNISITVHTARPGIVIGKKGEDIERLRQELTRMAGRPVQLAVEEVRQPELDAQLVAESIALQLEKRIAFRRAVRKAVDSAVRFGCKGIKVRVSGRLNGAEIARSEWHLQGRLPLQTIRADIDYGFAQAFTTYGVIGVKSWIYKGEILEAKKRRASPAAAVA